MYLNLVFSSFFVQEDFERICDLKNSYESYPAFVSKLQEVEVCMYNLYFSRRKEVLETLYIQQPGLSNALLHIILPLKSLTHSIERIKLGVSSQPTLSLKAKPLNSLPYFKVPAIIL